MDKIEKAEANALEWILNEGKERSKPQKGYFLMDTDEISERFGYQTIQGQKMTDFGKLLLEDLEAYVSYEIRILNDLLFKSTGTIQIWFALNYSRDEE